MKGGHVASLPGAYPGCHGHLTWGWFVALCLIGLWLFVFLLDYPNWLCNMIQTTIDAGRKTLRAERERESILLVNNDLGIRP